MACTLEELQKCEYEMLCHFADFCDKNGLEYVLDAGTLIGAVRHNGFIPWDDDVDVIMEARAFLKFVKKYRKANNDKQYSLFWIDDEKEYPLYYAKIRKSGTYMREYNFKELNINNGVWIDIFTYFYLPRTKFGFKIQDLLLGFFATAREKYFNRVKKKEDSSFELSKIAKFVDKCPDKILLILEKVAFNTAAHMGTSKSGKARYYYIDMEERKCVDTSFFQPAIEHIFCDRMLKIPKNYDAQLTCFYGDYMTPVKYHSHVDLSLIEI